jgi:hypothetical protein
MWGNKQIIKSFIPFLLLACSASVLGQRKNLAPAPTIVAPGGAASGTLTVTATVVTSVGVIMREDGQQRILIANAPDSADNVSHFVMLTDQGGLAADSKPKKSEKQRP